MLRTIREECVGPRASDADAVARAHAAFGTFVYQDDSMETKCGHIDGHDVLTVHGSCRKYGFGYSHTSEERWREIEGGAGHAHWGEGDVRDRDGVQGRSGVRRVERGRQRLASSY